MTSNPRPVVDTNAAPPPGPEIDLNALLAAATATIGRHVSLRDRLDTGGRPAHSTSRHICTDRILDAIASLCVSRPRAQVIAIALRVDFTHEKVHFIIAENTDGFPKTVAYLTALWSKLKVLSDAYATCRLSGQDPRQWDTSKTPRFPGDPLVCQLIGEIASLVYSFTEAKYKKRIKKWWDPLLEFTRSFIKRRGTQLDSLETSFERMMVSLQEGIEAMNNKTWPEAVKWLDYATDNAEKILEHNRCCENWAHDLTREDPFPLRRAIEELFSHHRHFRALIAAAHSPRLRCVFHLTMSAEPVPVVSPPGRITLPASISQWESFLESLTQDLNALQADWIPTESARLYHLYSQTQFSPCIHCECALIAHLERNTADCPALSYIAVSKPSCVPCWLWLEGFNRRGGRQYCMRGTDGRWCFPWSAPSVEGVEVVGGVVGLYVGFLKKGLVRGCGG